MKSIKVWLKNKPKAVTLFSDDETIMDFTDFMTNASGKSSFHFNDGGRHFLVYRNALQAFEVDYTEGKNDETNN